MIKPWTRLIEEQKNDRRNGERFERLFGMWENEGLDDGDIIGIIDNIYDNANYDDLLFLAYAFASYKNPLARKLLNHYGALRPDRFEGWDAPITFGFEQVRREMKYSKSGVALPDIHRIQDDFHKPDDPLVTIYLPAYNELEYVRLCVESLYKYTQGIDYDLLLKDNGSTDNVLEYFNRLPKKKAVARGERTGPDDMRCVNEPFPDHQNNFRGRYVVGLSADVILTPNWLHNLLVCAISNPDAAYICPTSNFPGVPKKQSLDIAPHKTMEEMLAYAARNNVSDPNRWEEHTSLIDFILLAAPENERVYGSPDNSFIYAQMTDYDRCLRIKKNGLKVICAKDCFCHHFGGVTMASSNMATRRTVQASIQILEEKHKISNISRMVRNETTSVQKQLLDGYCRGGLRAEILGLDDSHGESIQLIKNKLRSIGVKEMHTCGFASDANDIPLMALCYDDVITGDIFSVAARLEKGSFDFIITGGYINQYSDTGKIIEMLLSLLKADGSLVITHRNPYNFSNLCDKVINPDDMYHMTPVKTISATELERIIAKAGGVIKERESERLPEYYYNRRKDDINRLAELTDEPDMARELFCVTNEVLLIKRKD